MKGFEVIGNRLIIKGTGSECVGSITSEGSGKQEKRKPTMLYENTNAMPKHADGTVLHLGVKQGEGERRDTACS